MESVIVYLIVGAVFVFKIVKNYKKEQEKNKKRQIIKPTTLQPVPRPFSKKEEIKPQPIILQEQTQSVIVSEAINNRYISSIENKIKSFEEEGVSAFSENVFVDDSSSEINSKQEDIAFDLQLNTPQDYRRAFVHSLIFEKKY